MVKQTCRAAPLFLHSWILISPFNSQFRCPRGTSTGRWEHLKCSKPTKLNIHGFGAWTLIFLLHLPSATQLLSPPPLTAMGTRLKLSHIWKSESFRHITEISRLCLPPNKPCSLWLSHCSGRDLPMAFLRHLGYACILLAGLVEGPPELI